MNDSLVAINLFIKENNNIILLNKSSVPYLYYFNGEGDLLKDILLNKEFEIFIKDKCFNVENYAKAKLGYFYFNNGKYVDDIINIQDKYLLKDFNIDDIEFFKYYLFKHFKSLYDSAYHETYDTDLNIFDSIIDIYDKIQNKYPKRVIKSTVINYIRSELIKTDLLNNENTEFIIMRLENLLNEKN